MSEDWQSKTKHVVERSSQILASMELSDCAFLVGCEAEQEVIEAHKLILAMSSSVFKTMFYGSLPETQTQITVPDIEPETFWEMLNYIYTEKTNLVKVEKILRLWAAAMKYQLLDLAEQCADKLFLLTNAKNVWSVYASAKLFSNEGLVVKCHDIITYDCASPLSSEGFGDVSLETLHLILDAQQLNIRSEVEIFNAVVLWAKKECGRQQLQESTENLRKVSAGAVEKIRFLTMSPVEFASGPCRSAIFTKDESFEILVSICTSSETIVPPTFSSIIQSRVLAQSVTSPLTFGCADLSDCATFKLKNEYCQPVFIEAGELFSVSFCIPGNNAGLLGILLSDYTPAATVRLFNEENTHLGTPKWCSRGNLFLFEGPMYIEKGRIYTLRVLVEQKGTYSVNVPDFTDPPHFKRISGSSHFSCGMKLSQFYSQYDSKIIISSLQVCRWSN